MPVAELEGVEIAYEVVGEGQPWVRRPAAGSPRRSGTPGDGRGLSYFHPWDPADMVIGDNWRILHSVSGSPPESGRCMHRPLATVARGSASAGASAARPTMATIKTRVRTIRGVAPPLV